jgi:predicted negative regulator of RcsB-dependent stress response
MAIRTANVAKDPTNADTQRELSISHENLGDVLLAQRDVAGALAAYRAEMTILEALVATDASNAIWQQDVAGCHLQLGDALVAQRDRAAARAEYEAGRAVAQRLAASDPTNAELRELATTLANKVATCCGTKRATRAR